MIEARKLLRASKACCRAFVRSSHLQSGGHQKPHRRRGPIRAFSTHVKRSSVINARQLPVKEVFASTSVYSHNLLNGDVIYMFTLRGYTLDLVALPPLVRVCSWCAAIQSRCLAEPSSNGAGFDTSLNSCVASVRPSKTMLLSDLASSLRESGVDVVSLAAGEPDFDTPQEIIDAGIEALRHALLATAHLYQI